MTVFSSPLFKEMHQCMLKYWPEAPPLKDKTFALNQLLSCEVPDILVIVLQEVKRSYIQLVEKTLKASGMEVEIVILDGSHLLSDIIGQRLAEGVSDFVYICKHHVTTKTLSIQIA